MSCEDTSIRVRGLGKRFEMYAQPADRLKQMILPKVQRLTGLHSHDYFKEFWAVHDVSFSVQRGETVGIIGRNGSGKSTLLQIICGTLHPTLGHVETNGRIAALLELGAGFNPEFTGRENVFLSGLLYGISESELRDRFQSIVEFADIGDFIDQPVKTYSSGMYVRLAFSIAAHVDADILIIDEALSVGDVIFTQKCMRYLRAFQSRGTLVFVSHDTAAVTNLCSRTIWLDGGRMMMDGPAKGVVEHYLATQHAADRAKMGESVAIPAIATRRDDSGTITAEPERSEAVDDGESSIPCDVIDPRLHALNGTAQRNLLQVFTFSPPGHARQFGAGAARITNVRLLDAHGTAHKVFAGGEVVDLVIETEALQRIEAPIVGFHVKDRLGQLLFGDNTYLTYHEHPLHVLPGQHLRVHFRFRMPILPNGDYSVDAAFAAGTQEDHTQQDWVYDALIFRATESTMRHGLVGIPMHSIEIEREGAAT
ncbi:MAG TPA: ABC transporter ATP-binding protein [Rhodanobacteraceae bacterium]|nr:ABC transporter ATP-binding protein [Rhodanobacteraceae bacterium]